MDDYPPTSPETDKADRRDEVVAMQVPEQMVRMFEDPHTPDVLKNLFSWLLYFSPSPDALNHRLFGFELGMRFAERFPMGNRHSIAALNRHLHLYGIDDLATTMNDAIQKAMNQPFTGQVMRSADAGVADQSTAGSVADDPQHSD